MVYAPGTLETDPKKQNMALQQQASAIKSANDDIATAAANIATNTANIATNTTNISALQTKTSGYEAAWATYTPTITAFAGTFTSVSGAGRYLVIGKTVFLSVTITVTTNGTAATFIKATLPAAAATAGAGNYAISGRAASSGKMLQGRISAATSTLDIFNYDNTYPATSGETLSLSGVYESA